jgi:hypothetical protein
MHDTAGRSWRYRLRMIEASSMANGHTAASWGGRPLGIACPCGHRVVIELAILGITRRHAPFAQHAFCLLVMRQPTGWHLDIQKRR